MFRQPFSIVSLSSVIVKSLRTSIHLPTQLLAAVLACMPAISGGLTYGFSAILIPQLQSEDADISISLEQGSWIGD